TLPSWPPLCLRPSLVVVGTPQIAQFGRQLAHYCVARSSSPSFRRWGQVVRSRDSAAEAAHSTGMAACVGAVTRTRIANLFNLTPRPDCAVSSIDYAIGA